MDDDLNVGFWSLLGALVGGLTLKAVEFFMRKNGNRSEQDKRLALEVCDDYRVMRKEVRDITKKTEEIKTRYELGHIQDLKRRYREATA